MSRVNRTSMTDEEIMGLCKAAVSMATQNCINYMRDSKGKVYGMPSDMVIDCIADSLEYALNNSKELKK